MQGMKQVFVTKLDEVTTVDKEGIGSIRQEGNKWYKYVRIQNETATVTGVAGSLVAYDAVTGIGAHRVVIDLTDADANPVPAGALCGTCAGVAGTAYYGWLQTKGPCTLDTAVTSGAIGSNFILTTTDKTGTVATNGVDQIVGSSITATTGVTLDCPF